MPPEFKISSLSPRLQRLVDRLNFLPFLRREVAPGRGLDKSLYLMGACLYGGGYSW